jgi:hypothetical protein
MQKHVKTWTRISNGKKGNNEKNCRGLCFQTEELVKTFWTQFDWTYAKSGVEMIIGSISF